MNQLPLTLLHRCLPRIVPNGMRRSGVRVFSYHGVVEKKNDPVLEKMFRTNAGFKSHISFFRKTRILGLAELYDELSTGSLSAESAAVITFDDGYFNNLVAAEILSDFHIPWCLFVSTGAMTGNVLIWTMELSLLLLHGEGSRVDVFERVWDLRSRMGRVRALRTIKEKMKFMPSAERCLVMDEIRQQFETGEVERLISMFPSARMLTWEHVRQLSGAGVEIGSHGVEHEIHHAGQPAKVRRQELETSRMEIERQTGKPCRCFAFPNGDYCLESENEVEAAGYQLAFTTSTGTVTQASNPFLLPRIVPFNSLPRFALGYYWKIN